MKNEIIRLLTLGFDADEVAETLGTDVCMADELGEDYPECCGEDADCNECWKDKVRQIEKEI